MSNTNTGGPAFPWCGDLNECPTINLGMTLRDYFAAKAMHALVNRIVSNSELGRTAYEIADAMLKAREA
jgi:hypothetical protein